MWQSLGRALMLAVLDMAAANPCSRLGPPGGDGLQRLRTAVAASLARRTAKPPRAEEDDDEDDDEEAS